MQNRTIAALIVIVVVVVAVISMGCVELKPTTKIREIDEQHNKYANKKVTVEGDVGYADMAGFLLHGDTGQISVKYSGVGSLRHGDHVRVTGTAMVYRHLGKDRIRIKAESVKILKKYGY